MSRINPRFVVLAVLLALAVLTLLGGHLSLAMALAALKVLIVGASFMELREAHRAHLAVFAGWAIVVALGAWVLVVSS